MEKVDGEDVLRQRPQQYRDSKVPQHLKTDSQLIRESIKETAEPPQGSMTLFQYTYCTLQDNPKQSFLHFYMYIHVAWNFYMCMYGI